MKEKNILSQTNYEQKERYLSKLMRFDNVYFLTVMQAVKALGHLCLCGLDIVFLGGDLLLRDLKRPAICLFSKCVEST